MPGTSSAKSTTESTTTFSLIEKVFDGFKSLIGLISAEAGVRLFQP